MGNLDAKRDWGHAKDYVKAMWMTLQAKKADDWVISTGKTHSIRDLLFVAFKCIGITIEFKGKGINEFATVLKCLNPKYQLPIGKVVVKIDKKYYRPTEVDLLIGDSSKANKILNWYPEINFEDMIQEMVYSDLNLNSKVKN